MRSTFDADFMWDGDGRVLGVRLGFGACTEHEMGIANLYSIFGAGHASPSVGLRGVLSRVAGMVHEAPPMIGVDRRAISICPQSLRFEDRLGGNFSLLYMADQPPSGRPEDEIRHVLRTIGVHCKGEGKISSGQLKIPNKTVLAAWSDGQFAIGCHGDSACQALDAMHTAFRARDVCFGFKSDVPNWPHGSGLTFVIKSRVPQVVRDALREEDQDRIRLTVAAVATGIEQTLRAARKQYFALSPAWGPDKKSVQFWLNPTDQGSYKSGWFTVEALEQWARGEGPVLKEKADATISPRRF